MDLVIAASAVVTAERVLRPGWVRVIDDRISGVGEGAPPAGPVEDHGDALLVAGFVDVHCHGGGGHAFGEDPVASAAAAGLHLAHGTTTVLASLVSGPRDRMLREIRALSPLVHSGVLAGVHLEGPWLALSQCGAHDPAQLRAPEPHEVSALVGDPVVRLVTLAPELPGGLEAVRRIVGAGAVAAIGHTDADHATTRAAVAAGARHATHLFNAMRPVRHRDPGPVVALLEDDDVTVELIRDGVHLDAALCAWLDASLAPQRVVVVTDAMAAAGCADGRYRLGGLEVEVELGVARLAGSTTIAGGTATMDRLFAAVAGPEPTDAQLVRASRQTSANPARALRLADVGLLEAGHRADLVELDPATFAVRGVLRAGRWVPPDASGTTT
jgi:N-acetylglucosamine-6-phosphate deacetylase